MRDLPIPFSTPMVRAILREIEQPGTGKTQTRRGLVLRKYRDFSEFGPSDTKGYDWHLRDNGMRWHDLRHSDLIALLPYKYGDRLYVRESWRTESRAYDDLAPSAMGGEETIIFEADADWKLNKSIGRLRQGMHMPRWASRLTLSVTDVRVERLQEISEADAIAEGIQHPWNDAFPFGIQVYEDGFALGYSAVQAYRALWNHINAERGYGWDANPWVAAYTFRPILGNIDQVRP